MSSEDPDLDRRRDIGMTLDIPLPNPESKDHHDRYGEHRWDVYPVIRCDSSGDSDYAHGVFQPSCTSPI